jgi:hypothetical protein
MKEPDLIAIVLVLAATIGCINHLWIRLPPAVGMLAGSLLLSLMIVLSDRVLHLQVLSWFRQTLDSADLSHVFLEDAALQLVISLALATWLMRLTITAAPRPAHSGTAVRAEMRCPQGRQ